MLYFFLNVFYFFYKTPPALSQSGFFFWFGCGSIKLLAFVSPQWRSILEVHCLALWAIWYLFVSKKIFSIRMGVP